MITPADKMMTLFHFLIFNNERFGSISSSISSGIESLSPYIETYPPKGIALIEYLVSPPFLLKENNFGPKPIEYSKQ